MRHSWPCLVIACALQAGCHSTTLAGDASADPSHEGPDGAMDVVVDPVTDGWTDTVTVCPGPNPRPDGPEPYFEIDGISWPEDEGEVRQECDIENVSDDGDNAYTVYLSCETETGLVEEHTIFVRSNAPFTLYAWAGAPVDFRYTWGGGYWYNDRWFALGYEWGELIMVGVESRTLPTSVWEPLYGPLEITLIEGACGLESDECGTFERTGLRVDLYGVTRNFYDRTFGFVGSTVSAQVHVGRSYTYHDMECDDFPDRQVNGLIVMVPEG